MVSLGEKLIWKKIRLTGAFRRVDRSFGTSGFVILFRLSSEYTPAPHGSKFGRIQEHFKVDNL